MAIVDRKISWVQNEILLRFVRMSSCIPVEVELTEDELSARGFGVSFYS